MKRIITQIIEKSITTLQTSAIQYLIIKNIIIYFQSRMTMIVYIYTNKFLKYLY